MQVEGTSKDVQDVLVELETGVAQSIQQHFFHQVALQRAYTFEFLGVACLP